MMTNNNSNTTMEMCTRPGVSPIPLQNATEWETTGCNIAFWCPNNNATAPPQYCTPVEECIEVRLGSGTCPEPMGVLEPIVCPAGSYCPDGSEKYECPSKHYCPLGSYKPTACTWPALHCPAGSIKDTNLLALIILVIVDGIVLLLVLFRNLIKQHRARQGKTHGLRKGARKWMMKQRTIYSRVGAPGAQSGEGENGGVPGTLSEVNLDDLENMPIKPLGRKKTGFDVLMAENNNEAHDDTDLQLFVQSLSRCLGSSKFGLSFDFENLSFQPKGSPKKILDQVSGSISSGKLWAVMGASGAGKSTFVNVLMGKQAHTGGITKVGGIPGSISKYKKIIGYVPQDDIVLPELTVRENILHSARIRLPSSWTDREIQTHVDILISCLQLTHVRDSLVGCTAAPVISGGQRKRVSIGMELAAAPMALFLDEPTSGLDATASADLITTLKALSRMGITIVTIIHQPRQEIWEAIDSIILLGAGRLIYQGKGDEVVNYFQQECGFTFPAHGNPADIVMDIIAGHGDRFKKAGDTSVHGLIENWSKKDRLSRTPSRDSVLEMKNMQALQATIRDRGAPFYSQIWYCMCRSLVQQMRAKDSFFFELGVGGMAGSLIGLAYVSRDGDNFTGLYLQPFELLSSAVNYSSVLQMALLIGVSIGLTASAPGVKVFGEEKLIFWREAASGHNRFAYYLGKVLSTIPRMVLANVHFTTLNLVLTTPRISWGDAFFANQLYFYCIYGLASCVSMVTKREDGPLLATIMSLTISVMNGMSPSLSKVAKWHMTWLWRLFPGTWLAEAYFDKNVTPLRYLYNIDAASDEVEFKLNRFRVDMATLFALGTIYRVIAYLGLRYLNRNRQK